MSAFPTAESDRVRAILRTVGSKIRSGGMKRTGKGWLWSGLALLVAACAAGGASGVSDPLAIVERLLTRSADAWNRGDLETFVSDYAPESGTTFVAGGVVHHGIDWIRGNYAPGFAPGAARDSLRFERLEARALGTNHLLATARYVLFRGDSITSSGPFTLVLRKTDGEWKIIHDHTSRD